MPIQLKELRETLPELDDRDILRTVVDRAFQDLTDEDRSVVENSIKFLLVTIWLDSPSIGEMLCLDRDSVREAVMSAL